MNNAAPDEHPKEGAVLDACCMLNLAATGRIQQILSDLPYDFVVGARARGETLFLRSETADARDPVELIPYFDLGLLREHRLSESGEQGLFVEFAARVDDGEAEAAAIAVAHRWALATDDRKVRRAVAERYGNVRLLGTLELLQGWQNLGGLPDSEVAEVLRRIAFRATYRPRRADPLYPWWRSLVPDL